MINHHIQLELLKQAVLKSGCCQGTSRCSVHANNWSVHSNVHARSAWCVGCWARTALQQRTNAPVHEWDELAKGGALLGCIAGVHFFVTSQCMVRGGSTCAENAHDQKFPMCWAFKMLWSTHGVRCR